MSKRTDPEPDLFSSFEEPEVAQAKTPAQLELSPLAEVAVVGPVRGTFTYLAANFLDRLRPGMRVLVPFGARALTGFYVGPGNPASVANPDKLKALIRIIDAPDDVLLSPILLGLAKIMARRYAAPLGAVLSAMLPAGVKRGAAGLRVRYVSSTHSRAELLAHAEKIAAKKCNPAALLRTFVALPQNEPISATELLQAANVPESTLKSLERAGWLTISLEKPPEFVSAADESATSSDLKLTDEQSRALSEIETALQAAAATPAGFLLQGVTGSGKTEVYLRALKSALSREKQAIVLVPEIALTPQTAQRFETRLGRERVAVLHSHITDGERAETWRAVRAGKIDVVIGARSALFAPLPRLGIVIIDEEHENAFKQESTPRYHAREVAADICALTNSVLVLGSATPSFESFFAAKTGKLKHLFLNERATGQPLPPVEVVDLTQENHETQKYTYLSRQLLRAMDGVLQRGEQAILFMNRRGFATVITCQRCGHTERCLQCDITLTSHKQTDVLTCHYCGYSKRIPEACGCGNPHLKHWGLGTERVESEVRRIFPTARVARMDSDTMTRRIAYVETLSAFRERKIDILIGTQMIAKGLDFPFVTLVGVVLADTVLHMPDFRSRERTFQLLSQVAGRAGRSARGGRVIIQTHLPKDAAIRAAAAHDFEGFARVELSERREFRYPPYTRLARILIRGKDRAKTRDAAQLAAAALKNSAHPKTEILGPAAAAIEILEGQHRQHILIKSLELAALEELLNGPAAETLAKLKAVEVVIDVDAISMM